MDDFGFDARVWRLEQLLVDLPAGDSTKNESMYENEGLSDRIMKLQNDLESVLVDDKALREFVEKCKQAHQRQGCKVIKQYSIMKFDFY